MTTNQLLHLLALAGIEPVAIEDKAIRIYCPLNLQKHATGDSRPSGAIYVSPDTLHGFQCFKCGSKYHTLASLLGELLLQNKQNHLPNNKILTALVELEKLSNPPT